MRIDALMRTSTKPMNAAGCGAASSCCVPAASMPLSRGLGLMHCCRKIEWCPLHSQFIVQRCGTLSLNPHSDHASQCRRAHRHRFAFRHIADRPMTLEWAYSPDTMPTSHMIRVFDAICGSIDPSISQQSILKRLVAFVADVNPHLLYAIVGFDLVTPL